MEHERTYLAAAARARSEDQPLALAHALRHLSDHARRRGSSDEAVSAAAEAVAIYRSEGGSRPLDLANALRLQALALAEAGLRNQALPLWREARDLYVSLSVSAGVEEAEARLAAN
jgi:hypothetical protein